LLSDRTAPEKHEEVANDLLCIPSVYRFSVVGISSSA
jgi:hypothetical protein